ncbi:hypothetical protein BDN72DRAFT_818 [Pluteus cervinus]|uniref:Uncharacterized protein n=1 Tax=Pluteus cervinus TaxID=181527 RepID=A0ACD3BFU6_9AGAR|nr:hypothetical protein BDN72DRAFT_818 [Pluteus cervinus]
MNGEIPAVSNSDRLRVATALAVLKFKPPDQSIASYVLDLRSIFVSSSMAIRERETRAISEETTSWKKRALKLEGDYAALQAMYEAEQVSTSYVPSGPGHRWLFHSSFP